MENKLTAEQMEKLKACRSAEEAKALMEKENIELTDKELEEIRGRGWNGDAPGGVSMSVQSICYDCVNAICCNRKDYTGEKKKCSDYEKDSFCLTPDTLVTLADGSEIAVKDLTDKEELLVWNFDAGKADCAPILLIEKKEVADYEVIDLCFSDESKVGIVYEHGFFDVDEQKYIYLGCDAEQYIGHRFEKSGKAVELVAVEKHTENTAVYSPITYGHVCIYANGMLSITGGVDGMFNYFAVSDMKYDEKAMQEDIAKYGLFTYAEFAEIIPVPEYIFDGMNCKYMKIALGKGMVTLDTLKDYATKYAPLFGTLSDEALCAVAGGWGDYRAAQHF